MCLTWGYRREVNENCALLGHYAASSGIFYELLGQPISPIFKGPESFLGSWTPKDETDNIYRNVGKKYNNAEESIFYLKMCLKNVHIVRNVSFLTTRRNESWVQFRR